MIYMMTALSLATVERMLRVAEEQPGVGDEARRFNRDLRYMLRGAVLALGVVALAQMMVR